MRIEDKKQQNKLKVGAKAVSCLCIFYCVDGSKEGDDDDEDDDGFGKSKPMLPYSSMFIFGPTNP